MRHSAVHVIFVIAPQKIYLQQIIYLSGFEYFITAFVFSFVYSYISINFFYGEIWNSELHRLRLIRKCAFSHLKKDSEDNIFDKIY